MSHVERTQRCRGWLEEQLASLAGVRNANPRDNEFKAWRQATMTTLQRVWPDEPARVERFRRIAFRAPGARPEPEQIREWHRLGCELAHAYLTELVQDLDEHGAPVPVARTPDAARTDGGVAEDDFPVVELHDGESRAMSTPSMAYEDNVIDLGGPAGSLEPAQGRAADADSAPPTLRIELPAAREAAAASEAAPAPPTLHAAPKATQPASKNIKTNKKASAVTRLKDMLDFSKLEAQLAKEDAKAAQQDDAPAPAAPAAEAPAPRASSVFATQPRPLKRKPKPLESLDSLVPDALRPPAPPVPDALPAAKVEATAEPSEPPATSAPAQDPSLDADTFAAAADEFMRSSVVMSLTGKPVQRMSDATSFMDPDAVAVAALASDVGRLGVSEGSRGSMRAMLFELARHMDAGSLEWAMLRDAVAQAMESPELARRLLPVVLPWLDRAA